MTVDQQKTYNNCMEGHWSGAADTFFWGPFGWAFYDSLQHDCLAVAGSLGQATGCSRRKAFIRRVASLDSVDFRCPT